MAVTAYAADEESPGISSKKLKVLLKKHELLLKENENDGTLPAVQEEPVKGFELSLCLLCPSRAGYFDALVLDEASQFPIMNAPPLVHLLRRKPASSSASLVQHPDRTGRVVVVGDPRQMGTILQNEYPDDAALVDGSPPPHWSLLSWLRAAVEPCAELRVDSSRMLRDNHRMTDNLARFTREVLQYEGYEACHLGGCPCHQVAGGVSGVRPLSMSRQPTAEANAALPANNRQPELIHAALLPKNEFVLIQMPSGVGAAGALIDPSAAIKQEARLVVQLVVAYLSWRDQTIVEVDGKPVPVDQPSVFVVAPHHSQKIEIERELADAMGDVRGRHRRIANLSLFLPLPAMPSHSHLCAPRAPRRRRSCLRALLTLSIRSRRCRAVSATLSLSATAAST